MSDDSQDDNNNSLLDNIKEKKIDLNSIDNENNYNTKINLFELSNKKKSTNKKLEVNSDKLLASSFNKKKKFLFESDSSGSGSQNKNPIFNS